MKYTLQVEALNKEVHNVDEKSVSYPTKCDQTASEHKSFVFDVCMIDDDRICSASDDKSLKIWNIKTNTCVQTLTGHKGAVRTCVYLSKLDCIASGSDDRSIRLWNAATGKFLHSIDNAHTSGIARLLSLDDGSKLVSAGCRDDPTIKVWDALTYKCEKTMRGHTNDISALCLAKRNKLASASLDGYVMLWDLIKGECVATLKGHTSSVHGLAQLPNQSNLLASCSADKTMKIWDLSTLKCVQTIPRAVLSSSMCALSTYINHDYIVLGCQDGSIVIYDFNAEALQQAEKEKKPVEAWHTLTGHTNSVEGLCYLPLSNRLVSGSRDNTCKVWASA
eukprot:TRINITY_DN57_c3_g3_i1.p1 TRINITY_DN57_c3_g3~~TRINITY_DN57_c3_g3_i1.p1  ORF type:complete len:394 (-),score=122.28 TRINITY_DN57_c3_g3_i1:212-1216(-)